MTKDYTTVRVEKAAKRVADDAKADDETWSDYIRRCADADASVQRLVDADALAAELESDVADLVADRLAGVTSNAGFSTAMSPTASRVTRRGTPRPRATAACRLTRRSAGRSPKRSRRCYGRWPTARLSVCLPLAAR